MRHLYNNCFQFLIINLIFVICCVNGSPTNVTNSNRIRHVSEFEDSLYKEDILRLAKGAEIQSYLNEGINPCNNFYDFVCTNFPKFYPPNKDVSTSILQIMSDALRDKIAVMLNTPSTVNDTLVENQVKSFYESCVKVKRQSAESFKSGLLDVIGTFGKMPVLSGNLDWDEENFDWIAMTTKMQREYGKAALLQLDIAQDYRDSSENCLYIGQPKMLMTAKSMYANNSTAMYRKHMTDAIAGRLHKFLDVPMPLAEQTAVEIITLETWLSQGMWDEKIDIEKMNIPSSILYMQQKYAPSIDVERFVNLTVGSWNGSCVFESVESFQVNMRELLPKVPKYIIANYLYFMLLYDDFFLSPAATEAAQRTLCQSKVTPYFSKVLDNMVYRLYNVKPLERDIKMIFGQLKAVLSRRFDSNDLDWMKPKARYNALAKLQAMRLEFDTHDILELIAEFGETEIDGDDFIANIRELLALRAKQFAMRNNQPPKPIEADSLVSVMPKYLIQENLIKVPVSALQLYFLWTEGYPNSIKFGNLGSMLAHEMIHAFDDEGRKFDKHSNHRNWWDIDSMLAFNERKKCFIEQYNKFEFGSHYVRGENVLSENIADNGGIKLAYDAYMRWFSNIRRTATELTRETLPSLKYTNKQLFFISYAQFWCTGTNEELMNLQIATDTHSPHMFRVIGSLTNSPEFAKAFKCPIGSRMNPEKKCSIY